MDVTVVDLKGGGDGLAENRPSFEVIKSFEEFNQYYWYREELSTNLQVSWIRVQRYEERIDFYN